MQGGSAGANYRPGGDLGVRAQGNRSEIPGEDRCGRCARKEGRRGTGLPGGPWLSASAGDARAEGSGGVSGPSGGERCVGARAACQSACRLVTRGLRGFGLGEWHRWASARHGPSVRRWAERARRAGQRGER